MALPGNLQGGTVSCLCPDRRLDDLKNNRRMAYKLLLQWHVSQKRQVISGSMLHPEQKIVLLVPFFKLQRWTVHGSQPGTSNLEEFL
jgi:hypothetical protein